MGRFTLDRLATFLLPKPEPGRFFSPLERAPLIAAAEVLLDGYPTPATPEDVVKNAETFLIAGRSRRAWRIRVLLVLLEVLPLFLLGFGGRFSKLPPESRVRFIQERLTRGRGLFRVAANIRVLINVGAYCDPRAEDAVGFVPIPTRVKAPRERPAARAEVGL
jgi:hypothetical protein